MKLASFTIDGLYLKLDKKLILKVNKVTITHMHKEGSISDIEKDLDSVKRILDFFEYIKLEEIHFENENYSFLFSGKILYMTSDKYEIAAHRVRRVGNELRAIIDLIYIKKYDMRISSKLIYNYKNDRALVHGNIQYGDIKATFVVNKKKDKFYYVLKSNRFKDLKPLVEEFELSPQVSVWIGDKVRASSYEIVSFKGVGYIGKDGVDIAPETIAALVKLKEVIIDFKEGLKPVLVENATIEFNESNLYFHLNKPTYGDKNLLGSEVSIVGLGSVQPPHLKLDLSFDTRLDQDIHTILNAYGITLPIRQKGDKIQSKFDLDLNLIDKKVKFGGKFILGSSLITIGGVKLPVAKGLVTLKNSTVKLDNIALNSDRYSALIDGTIETKRRRADLSADVKKISFGTKNENLISPQKSKIPFTIDYKNATNITLPTLDIRVNIPDDNSPTTILLQDIKKITTILKNPPTAINGGNITLTTKEFNTYSFKGTIKRDDCFLYAKETECLTQIPIDGSYSKGDVIVNAFDNNLIYNEKKSLVIIKNLNFDLEKFFDVKRGESDKRVMEKKLKIEATNSTVKYKKYKLITDKYEIGLLPNEDFHFRGKLGKDIATVTKKGKKIDITANRIEDKMLHPLINFNGLQKGRYSIKIKGIPGKIIKGVIRLDGGVMSDFKAYNNTLALINTLPALATLHSPGFSREGFKIKQGLAKFTIVDGEKLFFDSIFIEGESATISGDGVIDLKTEKIDIDLAIQTAKPIGKLISKLPIVGYILMGDDESLVTVGLHIGGTLKKPKSDTSPVKDVLTLPFRMIERTLTGKKTKK